jgi:Holliday junction resolvasome RuvABC endonuclease subunit
MKHQRLGQRWIDFVAQLHKMYLAYSVDVVLYEKVMFHGNGVAASHRYGGFEALLEMFCAEFNLSLFEMSVGSIKKHATGNGRAGKDLMVSAAREKWPDQDIPDDNAADALWMLDMYLNQEPVDAEA